MRKKAPAEARRLVVVEMQHSGRASPSTMEEEEVLEREREAPKAKVRGPPFPPLYIGGLRGGRRP